MSILILPPEHSTCSFKSEIPHRVLPCDRDAGSRPVFSSRIRLRQVMELRACLPRSPMKGQQAWGGSWDLFLSFCDFGQVRQAL